MMKFNGKRLVTARESRGISALALSRMLGVTPAAISQYENKDQTPRPEILESMSVKLNFPSAYFFKSSPQRPDGKKIFWRSMSSATKSARTIAECHYEWFREIIDYLSNFLEFPKVNIPNIEIPDDFRKITGLLIETAANQVREAWNLGIGPISDTIRTLESNGIFVTRAHLDSEKLDALSEIDNLSQPYVFLNADKQCSVRSRFDAAHELGHMILHKNIDRKSINKPADFSLIESQAHHFAGAFLLPATEFSKELWAVSLDCFRSLKPKWKTSIAVMLSRCEQLNLISEDHAKKLWINRNRRGWREHEPLDDTIPVELPTLISKSFEMLIENKIKSKNQIVDEITLPAHEIEELACLPKGYLSAYQFDKSASPKLKGKESGSNIIPFKGK